MSPEQKAMDLLNRLVWAIAMGDSIPDNRVKAIQEVRKIAQEAKTLLDSNKKGE
jgi:hypothetical protein